MADHAGQQFGNYRLIRLLGFGGFAEVYLGEHIYLDTQAAVKVLYTQLTKDQVDQFLNEARTIARLEHPHIVRVLEFGIENGLPYLVMTYAPNGTVRQRYPKGVIVPLNVIVQYVQQIADALQYSHDQKVIHRDIKPENILLGKRSEVLLSDFGIATIVQSSQQSMQKVVGTVAYMAPEQLQGRPRPASDQYSLAIMVYEWLSGSPPFTGTFTEIASQHVLTPPPPLHSKVPTIVPEIEQVVMTALAKDPQQRFTTIWAFAKAFEQACAPILRTTPQSAQPLILPDSAQPAPSSYTPTRSNQHAYTPANQDEAMLPTILSSKHAQSSSSTPQAAPPLANSSTPPAPLPETPRPDFSSGEPQPSRQNISRRAVVTGIAGLIVAAGIGGAITWLTLSHKPVVPATPAPIPTTAHNTPPAAPTPTSTPSPSLGTMLSTYRGHSKFVYGVAWVTPDGQRIASASLDTSVQEWNATTGSRYFTYNERNAINDVKASLDGKHIASAGESALAEVRDAISGASILTYNGHHGAVNTVRWSPDGTRIVSSSSDMTVQVWNAGTGQALLTYRGHSNIVWAAAWSHDGQRIVSASQDGTAQVWDAKTGNLLVTYHGHSATVRSVSWSPDGQSIATASEDKTVQIWNSSTGVNILTYRGHTNLLRTVEWSHDGTRIVSGGKDSTAQIWDAQSGNTIFTYRGHSATVFDAQWSLDDTRIASGSTDTTVQVWQAK
jgi:WD40 repeat protein/tRNA A-37 threonylcarbamoyl transferase component Bud32